MTIDDYLSGITNDFFILREIYCFAILKGITMPPIVEKALAQAAACLRYKDYPIALSSVYLDLYYAQTEVQQLIDSHKDDTVSNEFISVDPQLPLSPKTIIGKEQ